MSNAEVAIDWLDRGNAIIRRWSAAALIEVNCDTKNDRRRKSTAIDLDQCGLTRPRHQRGLDAVRHYLAIAVETVSGSWAAAVKRVIVFFDTRLFRIINRKSLEGDCCR
jgi:hypothetical protein